MIDDTKDKRMQELEAVLEAAKVVLSTRMPGGEYPGADIAALWAAVNNCEHNADEIG